VALTSINQFANNLIQRPQDTCRPVAGASHSSIYGQSVGGREPRRGIRVSFRMPRCRKKNTGRCAGTKHLTTAKVLAPEDVRSGDYVALLQVIYELPSFFWCDGIGTVRPDEPVRVPFVPNDGGVPLRVRSICLPFILVKAPSGKLRNLDVRRHRLARLDRAHARAAWKARKKNHQKRERVKI
jgi:hypothetical protein